MNLEYVLRIIDVFKEDFSLELPILQVSKKARLNYDTANRIVKALIKEKALSEKKIGSYIIVRLNRSPLAFGYLCLLYAKKTKDVQKTTQNLNNLSKEFSFKEKEIRK